MNTEAQLPGFFGKFLRGIKFLEFREKIGVWNIEEGSDQGGYVLPRRRDRLYGDELSFIFLL